MLQKFKLLTEIAALRYTSDMDVQELTEFVGDKGAVCMQADNVSIAFGGPYGMDDMIQLEDDDVLVQMAGDLEIFTADEFEAHFVPVNRD